jgi:hypothetical protein
VSAAMLTLAAVAIAHCNVWYPAGLHASAAGALWSLYSSLLTSHHQGSRLQREFFAASGALELQSAGSGGGGGGRYIESHAENPLAQRYGPHSGLSSSHNSSGSFVLAPTSSQSPSVSSRSSASPMPGSASSAAAQTPAASVYISSPQQQPSLMQRAAGSPTGSSRGSPASSSASLSNSASLPLPNNYIGTPEPEPEPAAAPVANGAVISSSNYLVRSNGAALAKVNKLE